LQYARPSSDIENPGAWTTEPLYEKIDEEPFDDGDFVESPKSATGDSFTIGLSTVTDPGVHTNHVVRIRAKTGVSGTFKYELMQGAVIIKGSGDVVLTTAFAEYNMTLSEGEASNITDYPALWVRVTAIVTQKNQRQNVSWIRVDVPDLAGEEHSGTGSISGNGSAIGTIKKGGLGSAIKSAGGVLLAIGLAGMLAIASIAGGGSLVATGQAGEAEEHSGVAVVSGNGVLTGIITKQALGDSIIAGGGSIVVIGSMVEGQPGIVVISGNGTLIGLGTKSVEGEGTLSDGGDIGASGGAPGEAPVLSSVGSQVSREERELLLIGNPDDITFIGRKSLFLYPRK